MSTTFKATSSLCSSSTMASAASKTFVGSSFHNLTNHHVILSSPTREDVNLALSSSSSFRSNYSSVCISNASKSSIPANFANSSFAYSSSDTKENTTCPPSDASMTQCAEHAVKVEATVNAKESQHVSNNNINGSNSKDDSINSDDEGKEEVLHVFDENSSNSSSTQSSENTSASGRKRRRRGEEQILMEDLIGIDKSLADGIANHLKFSTSPSKLTAGASNSVDTNDLSNQQSADGELKKSKEDSPAFHLRPRRSAKSTSFSGYCSGSGSSSPISFLFSPVKRNKQPLMKKTINHYTQKLLSDTSKQLCQFLNNHQDGGTSGHNDASSSHSSSFDSKEDLDCLIDMKSSKPLIRSYAKSILREVDVSVFAELITPWDLEPYSVYSNKYLSLQICDIKPLRNVDLLNPETKEKLSCPLLELIALDINDRFVYDHTKGIFDEDPTRSHPSNKCMTVYLLGTYALKSNELASIGQVMNIVKFRTSKCTKITSVMQPPKKRKLLASAKSHSDSDDNSQPFPFRIIVDALADITAVSGDQKSNSPVKEEISQQTEPVQAVSDEYDAGELFNISPHICAAATSNWVPVVSFSAKWRVPDDPRELNKSLHIIQPSIPKFESASRTVKMNP